MAKTETIHPWQEIETQAFHAFREWPVWLVLRQKELAGQSRKPTATSATRPATEHQKSD